MTNIKLERSPSKNKRKRRKRVLSVRSEGIPENVGLFISPDTSGKNNREEIMVETIHKPKKRIIPFFSVQ